MTYDNTQVEFNIQYNTIFVQKFLKIGEEVEVERVIDFPGGKGANVAFSSARMLGRDKVVLFGALGSDLVANEKKGKRHFD